jgi:hypothetical protein
LVNDDAGDGWATVTLPYEFTPLPEKGSKGKALDRSGAEICDAEVVDVKTLRAFDHTSLLTIKTPKDMSGRARFFKREIIL